LRDCEWKIYESEQFFVFFNKENREKKRKLTKRKREKKRNLTKREREKKRKLTKRKREKELFCDFCKKEEKSSRHSHPTKK